MFAVYERDVIRGRTRAAIAAKRERGERVSRARERYRAQAGLATSSPPISTTRDIFTDGEREDAGERLHEQVIAVAPELEHTFIADDLADILA